MSRMIEIVDGGRSCSTLGAWMLTESPKSQNSTVRHMSVAWNRRRLGRDTGKVAEVARRISPSPSTHTSARRVHEERLARDRDAGMRAGERVAAASRSILVA